MCVSVCVSVRVRYRKRERERERECLTVGLKGDHWGDGECGGGVWPDLMVVVHIK